MLADDVVSVRVAGAVTHIISEQETNPSVTLLIVVTILETSGVSPLLVATLGFLGTVSVILCPEFCTLIFIILFAESRTPSTVDMPSTSSSE